MTDESATQPTETSATSQMSKKPKGQVDIKIERCKGCGFCVAFCPSGVLDMSTQFNAKGYHYPESVDPAKCTGCDLCGMYCPDFAIFGARLSVPKSAGKD